MHFFKNFVFLRMSRKVIFKTYNQDQLSLLPPSYDDLVPANHPVRIVNTIIDHVDSSALEKRYKGGGTSSYHPRMLLKVIIYAYLRNLYSSRKIEQALHENIHFMWLSGQSKPDHNTINDFRGKRLKGHFKKIFHQVVLLLVEQGVISLKDIFVDGTKIEANANRYTFVWGKSIKTSKERIKKQLKELWSYVEKVYKDEQHIPNTPDFQAIDADKIEATINQINDALKGKDIDKKVKQKLNYAKKNWPANMAKYQKQEAILKERNSYSKTDHDATFMRMKDDEWQDVIDVNLTSTMRLMKSVMRPMMKQKWGRIINITSIVGVTGNAGQVNYAASKAGMIGMSKSLAYEVASRGITVNAVAPGFIATAMTDKLTDDQKAGIMGQIPAGRMGTPAEIASAVVYLASAEAAYLTGTTLHVNGGMAML